MNRRTFLSNSTLALAGLGLLGASNRAQAQDTPVTSNKALDFMHGSFDADGNYRTPALPYAYDALEPIIDRETMRLHHDLHFESYTKGLNEALVALKAARSKSDYGQLSYWENQLAFHGAGYVLHTLFFAQMNVPDKSTPSSTLKNTLATHFGSFEAFQSQFNAAATQVQGSGWALLGYQPMGQKLLILQAEKHQNLTQWGIIPLLAIDVWEHAYYLKYQNRRADYVKAWWSVVDYDGLEARITSLLG